MVKLSRTMTIFYRANKQYVFLLLFLIICAAGALYYVFVYTPLVTTEQAVVSYQKKSAEVIAGGDADKCRSVRSVVNGINYEAVCRNNIALNLAYSTLDAGQCKKLDNNLMKIADCEMQVASMKLSKGEDQNVCSALQGSTKDECVNLYWANQTQLKNNVLLCERVSSENGKIFCQNNFWFKRLSENPKSVACSSFSPGIAEECDAMKKAINNKDLLACNELLEPELRSICSSYFIR